MVTHLHIEGALGQRDALALAIDGLYLVKHAHGLLVVLLLDIQAIDSLQQVLTALVLLVHLLKHRDSLNILSLANIRAAKGLHIGHILRTQIRGPLKEFQSLVGILHFRIVLRQEETSLRGVWLQFQATIQQVERGIVMAALALQHGFIKEHVVFALDILGFLGKGLRVDSQANEPKKHYMNPELHYFTPVCPYPPSPRSVSSSTSTSTNSACS